MRILGILFMLGGLGLMVFGFLQGGGVMGTAVIFGAFSIVFGIVLAVK